MCSILGLEPSCHLYTYISMTGAININGLKIAKVFVEVLFLKVSVRK